MRLRRLWNGLCSGGVKGHFGQWGEDVLVRKLFPKNKKRGTYLDLGSHHPFVHSNTAYFWMMGWQGFNVDANPHSVRIFKKTRPDDHNIWAAIIPEEDYRRGVRQMPLYTGAATTGDRRICAISTVVASVGAERGLSKSILAPAKSVSSLMAEFAIGPVDYLNMDIEGSDELVLQDIDFKVLSPHVVSVEDYACDVQALSQSPITRFMHLQGYELVGRAGPTSVFRKI